MHGDEMMVAAIAFRPTNMQAGRGYVLGFNLADLGDHLNKQRTKGGSELGGSRDLLRNSAIAPPTIVLERIISSMHHSDREHSDLGGVQPWCAPNISS